MASNSSLRNEAVSFAAQSAGMDDWVNPADVFFVGKIEEGLQSLGSLSAMERAFLFMQANRPTRSRSLSPTEAKKLNDKCIRGLTRSYKTDTAGKNKEAALHWNACNEWQYANSECVISGVVQNWYLSKGRGLEKKVVGLFGNPDW